jgi:hypothetical protein
LLADARTAGAADGDARQVVFVDQRGQLEAARVVDAADALVGLDGLAHLQAEVGQAAVDRRAHGQRIDGGVDQLQAGLQAVERGFHALQRVLLDPQLGCLGALLFGQQALLLFDLVAGLLQRDAGDEALRVQAPVALVLFIGLREREFEVGQAALVFGARLLVRAAQAGQVRDLLRVVGLARQQVEVALRVRQAEQQVALLDGGAVAGDDFLDAARFDRVQHHRTERFGVRPHRDVVDEGAALDRGDARVGRLHLQAVRQEVPQQQAAGDERGGGGARQLQRAMLAFRRRAVHGGAGDGGVQIRCVHGLGSCLGVDTPS